MYVSGSSYGFFSPPTLLCSNQSLKLKGAGIFLKGILKEGEGKKVLERARREIYKDNVRRRVHDSFSVCMWREMWLNIFFSVAQDS